MKRNNQLTSPYGVAAVLTVIALAIIVLISANWDSLSASVFPNTTIGLYNQNFWKNFIVEMHGIVLELAVVGVLIVWLESRRRTQGEIARLIEDLRDYASLDLPETNLKKLGHLYRLNDLGIYEIDVQNMKLSKNTINKVRIENSKMIGLRNPYGRITSSQFINTQMRSSNFESCVIRGSSFERSNLLNAKFGNAKCRGISFRAVNGTRADFSNCDLQSANFSGAELTGSNFDGANLRNCSFKNAQGLTVEQLAAAANVDYLTVADEICVKLKAMRPDMKSQAAKNSRAGREGIEPSDAQ